MSQGDVLSAAGVTPSQEAARLAEQFKAVLLDWERKAGGPKPAAKPGHRVPFHWPPHPVSHSYHVHPTDWRGEATVEIHGESFPVEVARTPHGVFGRVEDLWLEARGDTEPEMLESLKSTAEPLFCRQLRIGACLGRKERFSGTIRDLDNLQLLRLLYCEDRDVSHEAATCIELRASSRLFLPSMALILRDRSHPWRRAAHWAVLDLLEDFDTFCTNEADRAEAVSAIRELIWDAEDDFARAIFKAGVVLGGHFPASSGLQALLECLEAPSPIGRRSAMHGLFHVVEWEPETRAKVVAAMRVAAIRETVPELKEYAERMADDIEKGAFDHVAEPLLPGEV